MATDDVKRKLSAIFSADVEGYSRLMGEDELATIETLTSHKEIMRKLIRQYRGRVVDSTGDNLLAEFASVVDAVQCAVEVQQVLSAKNETLPENRRMYFRIGINLGDVVQEGEVIYGDGVNVAARVESLAEGGGISISGTAYDQLGKKLPLGYEYLGEQTVKNIEKPVRVYRILTEAEAAGKVIGEEKPKTKQLRWAAIGGVVVLILVAGALAIWNFYIRPAFEPASVEQMAYPLPDKPSIAVLPFVNMSGDPEQEYFSDGLTEEIITALSKVPKVFVIARNSTFSYKGKPVKVNQVAEELGVQYLVEGSVRRAEDQVRITAQLIDALSGRHIWAERYDREFKDIFTVQDEITKKIITSLQVELTEGEQARVYAKGTENLAAYLKVLQGTWHSLQGSREGNAKARRLAEEAIALDPNYPFAYRLLGLTHRTEVFFGTSKSPRKSIIRAMEASKKAIALDESLAIAYAALGYDFLLLRQHDKAIALGEKALELEPNSADILQLHAAILTFAGRREEAIPFFREALRLNPKPPNIYYRHFGVALRDSGQYEEAIALQRKAIEQEPKDIIAYIVLVSSASLAGRDEEAQAAAEEMLRLNPKFSVARIEKISPHKDRAVVKRFCDALRKAGLPQTPALPLPDKPSIAVLPFVNMSGDPEQEYFSDGITEEIITALSKTPKLFVIARNSTFTFKGKSVWVPDVGRKLGVRYVLEGSVRKAGDKVRITANLIDAKTNHHLWAERYDRELKDVFAVQDEITLKVLAAIHIKMEDKEELKYYQGTNNLEAFLKVLQGRYELLKFTRAGNILGRELVQQAIVIDPEYAAAYNSLAGGLMISVWFGLSKSPKQTLIQAIKMAQKAVEIDESFESAYGLLAFLYTMVRKHELGVKNGERAVSLNPNCADCYGFLGIALRYSGKPKEAVANVKKAMRLNPFPKAWYYHHLGGALSESGQYKEAIQVFNEGTSRYPDDQFQRYMLAWSYIYAGREEDARAQAAEVLRINPNFSVEQWAKAYPHVDRAVTERHMEAMRKAGLK
jgi:adenylate cyclase